MVDEVAEEQSHRRYTVLQEPPLIGAARVPVGKDVEEYPSPSFVDAELAIKSHSLGFMDEALHHMVDHRLAAQVLDDPYYQTLSKLVAKLHAACNKLWRKWVIGLVTYLVISSIIFVTALTLWNNFTVLWCVLYLSANVMLTLIGPHFIGKNVTRIKEGKAVYAACILWLHHKKKIDYTQYTDDEIKAIDRWLTDHKQ